MRPGSEWRGSAAVQLGISFTTHTLSLYATNSASSTLQGLSRGAGRTRWGFEFTAPIPLGRFLGWYVPRQEASGAVRTDVTATAGAARVEIARYLFGPGHVVVPVGATVEWINRDGVVHTVDAEDGSWRSGAIQPGETWRATFERPGRYPYDCGPHPFMKGVVIVR